MNDFTTKIITCLAKGEMIDDTIQELSRKELEKTVNDQGFRATKFDNVKDIE